MPVSPPPPQKKKIGFGGIWSLSLEIHQGNPRKLRPSMERHRMTCRSSELVHRCDLCSWLRNHKKTKKTYKSPDDPRCQIEILFGNLDWLLSDCFKFQILSQLAEWLLRCHGSKFAFSHYFGQRLRQQPVLPYKLWCVVQYAVAIPLHNAVSFFGTILYLHMCFLAFCIEYF